MISLSVLVFPPPVLRRSRLKYVVSYYFGQCEFEWLINARHRSLYIRAVADILSMMLAKNTKLQSGLQQTINSLFVI